MRLGGRNDGVFKRLEFSREHAKKRGGGLLQGNANEWQTREGLALIAGWRRHGETPEQIAERMGIEVGVLERWRGAYEEIGQALQIDRDMADFMVEEALFHKSLSGDAKAYEFWLKHRMPDKWGKAVAADERGEVRQGADFAQLADLINNPVKREGDLA